MISAGDEACPVPQGYAVRRLEHAPVREHARLCIAAVSSVPDGAVDLVPDAHVFEIRSSSVGHQDRRVARHAIGATMTASPVRVDARVEADVGAVVAGDDGAGVVPEVDGLGARVAFFELGGVGLDLDPLEAVLRVAGSPAADDAPPGPLPFSHPPILTATGADPHRTILRPERLAKQGF